VISTPRNGTEAGRQLDPDLEHIVHLYLLNRGVLITPFHNMILVCPDTSAADVDRLVSTFDACLAELT
jgi:glutamate-1-semialdehyde 2,1-aminomutase